MRISPGAFSSNNPERGCALQLIIRSRRYARTARHGCVWPCIWMSLLRRGDGCIASGHVRANAKGSERNVAPFVVLLRLCRQWGTKTRRSYVDLLFSVTTTRSLFRIHNRCINIRFWSCVYLVSFFRLLTHLFSRSFAKLFETLYKQCAVNQR